MSLTEPPQEDLLGDSRDLGMDAFEDQGRHIPQLT